MMSAFVEVHTASNVPDAYVIKAALEGAGITVQIANEYLEFAMGGVPADKVAPRVLVPRSQADAAREVLREMASQPDRGAIEDLDEDEPGFPRALKAPEGRVVVITRDLVAQAVEASRRSPRKRIILPFHKSDDCSLHRMLNAVQPGSYLRPHWHRDPPKDESLVLLQGAICVFLFEEGGRIRQTIRLKAGSSEFAVDLVAGVCHTFIALERDTVVFEVKPGPYERATDKDYAAWSPAEGTARAQEFVDQLYAEA